MCIPTPNTGQLVPLFHTFAEFTLRVNRIVAWQSTDWLAANAQFSPNVKYTNHIKPNPQKKVFFVEKDLCLLCQICVELLISSKMSLSHSVSRGVNGFKNGESMSSVSRFVEIGFNMNRKGRH